MGYLLYLMFWCDRRCDGCDGKFGNLVGTKHTLRQLLRPAKTCQGRYTVGCWGHMGSADLSSTPDFIFWSLSWPNKLIYNQICSIINLYKFILFQNNFLIVLVIQKFCLGIFFVSEQKIVIEPCTMIWLRVARATLNICVADDVASKAHSRRESI